MNQKNRNLIEKIVLVYSPIFLVVLMGLVVLNHAFFLFLVIAYFVYVIEFVLVAGFILFEGLLNKNLCETKKI